jgi:hypothetical protein
MIILLLKLLLANCIGDFVLQSSKWVADKQLKKHKSKYLYLHLLIHTFVLLVLLKFNWSYWLGISIIIVSHYIIDLLKLHLDGKLSQKILFLCDQALHLAVIGIVINLYHPFPFPFEGLLSAEVLLFLLAIILLSSVSPIIMRLVMTKWGEDIETSTESLPAAGKYIGILERLFVFGFIVLNQWPSIGLLIAAKSVFRFGDLSKAKDRKLTEYILIGTLLSFGIAMIVGLAYCYGMNNCVS